MVSFRFWDNSFAKCFIIISLLNISGEGVNYIISFLKIKGWGGGRGAWIKLHFFTIGHREKGELESKSFKFVSFIFLCKLKIVNCVI